MFLVRNKHHVCRNEVYVWLMIEYVCVEGDMQSVTEAIP